MGIKFHFLNFVNNVILFSCIELGNSFRQNTFEQSVKNDLGNFGIFDSNVFSKSKNKVVGERHACILCIVSSIA